MQTVISVFEDRQTAQRAVDRLIDAGFDRERVHLEEGAATANTAAATTPTVATIDPEPDRGVLSSIGHFLASIFNQDQPAESKRYAEAVRRGHPVVVVDARDAEQANRAAAIARELGAFDIDEHYALWQGSDMSAGTSSSTGVVMGTGQQMRAERPAQDEGSMTGRSERERAMASDLGREPSARENDIEAREPKSEPKK